MLAVVESSALLHKGRLFMHGRNAQNCAMMHRHVILLRSEHKKWGLIIVIFIVIFTSRMNAKKRTINQWELIIMKYTETFNIPRMMILESGVVFVVRLVVERRIMHALTLHIHK